MGRVSARAYKPILHEGVLPLHAGPMWLVGRHHIFTDIWKILRASDILRNPNIASA